MVPRFASDEAVPHGAAPGAGGAGGAGSYAAGAVPPATVSGYSEQRGRGDRGTRNYLIGFGISSDWTGLQAKGLLRNRARTYQKILWVMNSHR